MITYYRVSKRGEVSFKRDHMLLDRLPTLATHEQCIHFRTDRHSMVCYFLNGRVFAEGPFVDGEGNYVESPEAARRVVDSIHRVHSSVHDDGTSVADQNSGDRTVGD